MSTHIILPKRSIGLIITAALALIAGITAFVYLPKASLRIIPATITTSVEQTITLSTSAKEPDFVRFILPVSTTEKESTRTLSIARDAANIFDDFAKGSIILTNNQEEEQSLLPKTHVRHEGSGVQFLTDSAVTIPAGGQTAVTVTAKEKGAAGNVGAGTFIVEKLPQSTQKLVFGESKQQFSGGIATDTPISESEIASAKEKLIREATDAAIGELTLVTGGAAIRKDLVKTEILAENVSVQPGSNALEYTLSTTVRARAVIVDENDILSLAVLALRAKQSQDEEFISYDPNSFSTSIAQADFERGEILIHAKLAGTVARKIGPSVLATQNIAGLSEDEVRDYFKQFEAVGNIEVSFWPFWVRTIPSRPGAVEITVSGAENAS